ncbi:hypothetical protein GCM10009777_33290 [Microbacterium pumilum]|uniref:Uncharacterized protein n=1 Tax=Microbacterium pumilum TaxID=344165 RepID=A0ABN2SYG1_9MICO
MLIHSGTRPYRVQAARTRCDTEGTATALCGRVDLPVACRSPHHVGGVRWHGRDVALGGATPATTLSDSGYDANRFGLRALLAGADRELDRLALFEDAES